MLRFAVDFDWSLGDEAPEDAHTNLMMEVEQSNCDFAAGDVWQEGDSLLWEGPSVG